MDGKRRGANTEFVADGFNALGVLSPTLAKRLVGYVEAWRRKSIGGR